MKARGWEGLVVAVAWSVSPSPASAQPPDSLTVTVVNETGGPLTDVLVFFLEEENLLPRRLEDGGTVEVRVQRDGCLYHVFGEDRKSGHTFRRYGADLCQDPRIVLTPADRLPDGEERADADFARLLDVYLSRAPSNFEGLVDLSDPPDAAEYDLRFYFPVRGVGDTYFLRRDDGHFVLRLELATFANRGAAVAAVPERCAWLESLPLATPLHVEPAGPETPGVCRLGTEPGTAGARVEVRLAVEPVASADGRTVLFAEIAGVAVE
jgi:hypothetical protein